MLEYAHKRKDQNVLWKEIRTGRRREETRRGKEWRGGEGRENGIIRGQKRGRKT